MDFGKILGGTLQVAAIGLLALCLLFLRRRFGSSLRDIPGPFLASISKVWQIWHAFKGDMEKAVLKLHQKHGPFVRISHEEVSCSHPDAVRAVLLAPLTKGDWYKACAIPDKYHQTSMSEVDPKRKAEMKKIFASGYLSSNVLRSEEHLDECLNALEAHLTRFADTEKPVNLGEWFAYWSFDSIAGLVFGGSFGFLEQAKDIGGAIANIHFLALYLSITANAQWIHELLFGNPILKWVGFKPKQHIMDTTEAATEARRRKPEAGHDMIEQWGLALRKTKTPSLKEEDLIQNAGSTVTAGAETSPTALQAFVYYCLRHPTVQAKLVAEVDAAQTAGQLSPTIQASEALNLPYLQAVLKECLRIFPPVPAGLPRKVPTGGLEIGGRRFPAGATVSVNPHVMHRNRECFGPKADEFIPERWLGEEGKALDKCFVAFGQGYNSCPGRQIAFIQLSKAAAMLTREFEFQQVEKGSSWTYENRFTVLVHDWSCYVRKRIRD